MTHPLLLGLPWILLFLFRSVSYMVSHDTNTERLIAGIEKLDRKVQSSLTTSLACHGHLCDPCNQIYPSSQEPGHYITAGELWNTKTV